MKTKYTIALYDRGKERIVHIEASNQKELEDKIGCVHHKQLDPKKN